MCIRPEDLTGVVAAPGEPGYRAPRPRDPRRGVSMADVAARAGVSAQTVSRVVNASPRVDPVTRRVVEAAMAELGYRVHRAARALRTGRTQTVGLVVSTLESVGNSRMLQAVADAAAARGYALTVVTLGAGGVATAFEQLRDQGVDGAIVLNEASAVARGVAVPEQLALVVVDAPADDAAPGVVALPGDQMPAGAAPPGTTPERGRFAVIATDHVGGARAATEHLLALGHETVWHLAGPASSFAADERETGWRAALGGRRVPPPVRGDWTAASGHRAGVGLARIRDLTAVFAANDQMALGLLRALAEAGRAVPEEVSVVGFDDLADAADYRPPLTTVRQDFDALGERALATLIAEIEGAAAPATARVTTTLVERASTAPAP